MPICLTDEEVKALRGLLAMLAILEVTANRHPKQLVEISLATWQEMLKQAQPLVRISDRRLNA